MLTRNNPLGGLRSSLSDAAFAVEERVLWRGEDGMKGLLDSVKWPFERAAWALERAVVWPLQERTGDWSGGLKTLGVGAVALVAVAAGVLGLVWASGSGGGGAQTRVAANGPSPAAPLADGPPAARPPALHGPKPNFKLETVDGSARVDAKAAGATSTARSVAEPGAGASTAPKAVDAGPVAKQVAHRFAGAFVLYETGKTSPGVRATFGATATPRVAQMLLRRPPRLPADAKVPQAKVLNIVPGPREGDTYTLSVSLLRLGITSELRLAMQRDGQTGKWRVTEVLG